MIRAVANKTEADAAEAEGGQRQKAVTEQPSNRHLDATDWDSRELAGRMLGHAMAAAGCSRERMAKAAGVSKSLVSRWVDGEARLGTDKLVRVSQGVDPVARRAAESWLDQLTGVIRSHKRPRPPQPLSRHSLQIGAEVGDLHRLVAEVLEDGRIDPSEAAQVRRHLMRLSGAISRARRDIKTGEEST